ncbi:MAG: biopolymer transporter ExbB, partial [Campylobacter sp.]|nr:biopolymer transporter ExbB [Campylobacter sp.]
VKSNGGIEFLHNINGRNIISVMNLQHKDTHKVDGKKINAYIIANCYEPSCLVSNRFSGFGRVNKNIYVK